MAAKTAHQIMREEAERQVSNYIAGPSWTRPGSAPAQAHEIVDMVLTTVRRADDYHLVADEEAPEGVVVETVSPGGLVATLKRSGNLWFLPDGAMYVYYTPLLWREVPEGPRG